MKKLLMFILLVFWAVSVFAQTTQTNPDSIPFAPAVNYGAGDRPISVFCADLDGDTDLDLAIANDNSDNVSILKNNGDGTFASAVNYGAGDGPESIFCADLDGDGDLDLAVANWYSDNVSILKNNGDGTFTTAVNYGAGDGPMSVFCADLDGDTDLDLAVANHWSHNVSILKNNGNGTFGPAVNYGAGHQSSSVFCADLDGDTDLDLAVANHGSDNVSILKNNGDGTFATAVNYGAGDNPYSIFCADLDGDTDLDLAVANWLSDNVSILKNNGDGTFPTAVNYGAGRYPESVFCADLDGDTDLDLAVANSVSDNVSILKNNGDGTFATAVNYGAGGIPYSVFCADLDGDTDLDLAVANAAGNVSILINLTAQDPRKALIAAIDELENAIKARDYLIAQDVSWTMVYAYRSIHDLDAMWAMIDFEENLYDFCTLIYTLGEMSDNAGNRLLRLKDLGPIRNWIVGVAVGKTFDWVEEQYENMMWAYTLKRVDGFNYVNENQLYTDVQNLVMTDPNSVYIQGQIEYVTQICSNLRQYVQSHDYNDATSFNQLIRNVRALAQDIRTSNESGEKEVVKWYCPTSHTNINPPIPEKLYNIVNFSDWTSYIGNCSYYNSMYSMWEELTNNRRTELTGYVATVAVAGAALIIKTGLISFFSAGTLAGPETALALGVLGTVIAGTTNSYKAADASAAASSIINILQIVIPATSRDLIEMDMMLNDVKTYVERSMDPAYPPNAFPFGLALIYDMDIPHTVYHSGDVPVLIEGTVKLRNYGPYEGKANLYFEVKARSGPLRGQTISIASIAEPVNVPVSQYVQIPFSITVPQSWLLGGEGRFVANPHATIGAGRFSLSSVTFNDRCFEVIQTDKQKNTGGRDVFNIVMQDSIGQGDSLSASYTSNGYETEFWLDHTEGSMTLHLYDNTGNHTGYNYETQQIETQIPGSSYIGSSLSTDLIAITGSMGQQYTVQVKGIAIDGKQAFNVTAEEVSEHPPSLMTAPPSLVATGFLGDTIGVSFEIFETGCHHQVNGLTLSASDFVGGSGSIPSSNVVFDLPVDSIGACQNIVARAKITIPIDAPIEDYVGSFIVNSLNGGSDQISLTIHLENPPSKPTAPSGPSVGLTNVVYKYTSVSVDPDNDSIYYLFDWGDSSHNIWSGQVQSAEPCTVSHAWEQEGAYYVKVKAMDIWNLQSDWSDSTLVTISLLRGDANGDGVINSADVSYLINYLFVNGPVPNPLAAGDANCDGNINSADVAYLINYLFVSGPPPGC
jgi:ankyrin repeat protein